MKLDQITEKETTTAQVVSKKRETATTTGYSGSILELLNPLKSVNINSDLHSFNNFRESKESIEALLKAQSNLVFYVLHQNFMCDDVHKEFFKNMVGRFYDLHEKFWDYYRGVNYFSTSEIEALSGLILLENGPLYLKTLNGDYKLIKRRFEAENSAKLGKLVFNSHALLHFHGIDILNKEFAWFYFPFNRDNSNSVFTHYKLGFENSYEYGRFKPLDDLWFARHWDSKNDWYIITEQMIASSKSVESFKNHIKDSKLYASIGVDNMDKNISFFNQISKNANFEFKEDWIPQFDDETKKKIRSISQTFQWSKEFIFENEDLLNLDVLGLNMTVPWDMELVKFFVKRGYGGRMSENKAVFDKVFKPLLTDEILDMLFRLEYEKY